MSLFKTALLVFILQNAAPQPSQPPRTGSIEGSVVGTSGERLAKVSVTLTLNPDSSSPDPTLPNFASMPPELIQLLISQNSGSVSTSLQSVTTDADGKFIFENLRPGSYRLEAARPGFVTTKYGQKGANGREAPVVVAVGQKVKDIQIAMLTAGSISGRIVDRNGEPISRATVQAMKYRYTERGRVLTLVQSVTTNDLGEYRLFWLAPGSYVVSALPQPPAPSPMSASTLDSAALRVYEITGVMPGSTPGSRVTSRTLNDGSVAEESPVTVYYPGTVVPEQASAIVVRAATTESGINITALPARVHRIRGVTLDGTGSPASMSLSLISKTAAVDSPYSSPLGSLKSNNNGTFEIAGVTSGSYFLGAVATAISVNAPLTPGIGIAEVEVGNSDVSNVRVAASVGFSLKGRVVTEGLPLQVNPSNTARRILLSAVTQALLTPSTVVEPDGTFVFSAVFPGDYLVSFPEGTAGAGYIKSVRFGGQEVLSDGLHIRGQPDGELTVVLSVASGKLEGRVLNDRREPVSNATIVIVPEPSLRHRTSLFLTPRPDAAGKFKINVVPGRYKVFAWEDVEPGAWFDTQFMQNYESRGVPVTIGEGSTEAAEITVIPYVP